MAAEVRAGLASSPPTLPCKYFYDDRGGQLFDEITRLPEYYPTRTEERILERVAGDVVGRVEPDELLELGSGIGRKIRLVLDRMKRPTRCVLLDVNEACLATSVETLSRDYPGLVAEGVAGDFTEDLPAVGPGQGRRLALFFAGTVGNLHPGDVPRFLGEVAAILAPGDAFLVGVDLVKDVGRLEAAYDDAAGVTASFNLNILRVVNERLGADFDVAGFRHVAFYDREQAWIEMRLRATRPSRTRVAGLELGFDTGDEIRTEISCKYTRASFAARVPASAFAIEEWYTDPEELFALVLLRRTQEGLFVMAPLPVDGVE